MDYIKIYNQLVDRAKNRNITGYTEKHHIIPRCMGGTDLNTNLVKLTPEEHFVAHILLVKMYPNNNKLIFAANNMCMGHNGKRTNRKLYGWLKRKFVQASKENQQGNKNSQFGKMWIYNIELEESKSITKNELEKHILLGWKPGRVIDFTKQECCICKKQFFNNKNKTKTCSKNCLSLLVSTFRFSSLLGREDEFLDKYQKYNSMNKALKEMGVPGATSGYYNWAKKVLQNKN